MRVYAYASLGRRDGLISAQSPHQSRAFRRGRDVVTIAEISSSRRTNDAVCIFSYEYLSKTGKSNCTVKRIGESARWADLTIRLVVKANSVSAKKASNKTITFDLFSQFDFSGGFCNQILKTNRSANAGLEVRQRLRVGPILSQHWINVRYLLVMMSFYPRRNPHNRLHEEAHFMFTLCLEKEKQTTQE